MLTRFKAQQGMSLVEIMIGVILIGILAAMAIPAFTSWIANTRIRTISESFQNGLQVARNEALRRGTNIEFILTGTTGWAVQDPKQTASCVADLTLPQPAWVVQSRPAGESSAKDITVVATPAASVCVTFTSLGRVRQDGLNADGSAALTQIDVNATGLAAGEARPLSLVINPGGLVKMCDPNVSTGDSRAC